MGSKPKVEPVRLPYASQVANYFRDQGSPMASLASGGVTGGQNLQTRYGSAAPAATTPRPNTLTARPALLGGV